MQVIKVDVLNQADAIVGHFNLTAPLPKVVKFGNTIYLYDDEQYVYRPCPVYNCGALWTIDGNWITP
jgi:hypothetical protein